MLAILATPLRPPLPPRRLARHARPSEASERLRGVKETLRALSFEEE